MDEREWMIIYRKKRGGEHMVVMPTTEKLLDWIRRNAGKCSQVKILMEG